MEMKMITDTIFIRIVLALFGSLIAIIAWFAVDMKKSLSGRLKKIDGNDDPEKGNIAVLTKSVGEIKTCGDANKINITNIENSLHEMTKAFSKNLSSFKKEMIDMQNKTNDTLSNVSDSIKNVEIKIASMEGFQKGKDNG
jgi:hypothetical protein